MRRPKNLLPARGLRARPLALRCAAVLAAGLGLAVAGAGLAAATGPQPIAPSELSKATTAARSSTATTLLTKAASTAHAGDPANAGGTANAVGTAKVGGTATVGVTVAQDTQPIYALNPAFVRDPSAPVATFWYAATSATAGGKPLTVYTTPDSHGTWHAVNVATGNTESRMIKAAAGATVFTEPQLGAWYALTPTQIRPLNPSAIQSIGSKPITITAYQDLVSHRYSDKLPGSHYNDLGTAGGYAPAQPPAAVPGAETAATVAQPSTLRLTLPIAATGATAAALLFLAHRRLKPRN